jgi:hypothetical protein
VAVGLVVRVGLSANVLNLLYPYSLDGGSPILKIHPGSYLLLFAGAVATPSVLRATPMRRNPLATATATLIAVTMLVGASMTVRHDTSDLGYLVDSILIAPLSLIAMARLSIRQRVLAVRFILGILCVNGALVVAEFVVQRNFLPYPFRETLFRPVGLFDHPLQVGLMCVAALPYLFVGKWPPLARWALLITIATTVALSQARIATLVTGCLVPIGLACTLHEARRTGGLSASALFVLVTTIMLAMPMLVIAAGAFGIFERLSLGLADSSAYARVAAYDIFRYCSWNDVLYGIGAERAQYYAKYGLGLDTIESPIVITVAQFGVPGAAILLGSVVLFLASLTFRAPLPMKLGVLAFCITALSNNAFTSKGPALVTATVLLFAGATVARARQTRAVRRRVDTLQWKPT